MCMIVKDIVYGIIKFPKFHAIWVRKANLSHLGLGWEKASLSLPLHLPNFWIAMFISEEEKLWKANQKINEKLRGLVQSNTHDM